MNVDEAKDQMEQWFRDNQDNIKLVDYDEYSNVLYIQFDREYSVQVSPDSISIRGD